MQNSDANGFKGNQILCKKLAMENYVESVNYFNDIYSFSSYFLEIEEVGLDTTEQLWKMI